MRKARFLAVDPHWREYDDTKIPKSWGIPSAGLAHVIAAVKDAGGEIAGVELFFTELRDRPKSLEKFHEQRTCFLEGVLKKADREQCNAIIVTMTNGAYHHVLELIEMAEETSLTIIVGGSFITLSNLYSMHKHILFKNSTNPNLVTVEGEGEVPVMGITSRIMEGKDFSDIPGVVYRKNGEIFESGRKLPKYDIDTIPMADYSDFDRTKLAPSFLITRSRGCPANCAFCDERDVFQHYRLMSNKRVIKEIIECMTRYNMTTFKWTDSTFTGREKDVVATCWDIINEGLNDHVQWLAYARIKEVLTFQQSTLELMNQAGCIGLHYGFETFDECVLVNANKGYKTVRDARHVVKRTKDAGMKVTGSFMNGFPGQTEAALWKSIEYSIDLDLDVYNIHAAAPPIKQMENPSDFEVKPIYRPWNNDPNIPANLFQEYSFWHLDRYGVPDTLGRHTTSKELAMGLKPKVRQSAYQLQYDAKTLLKSMEMFMADGRESIEYDLFFREMRTA